MQNTQSLQYKQMQIALQTAQNQASIETPLRAEQLMMAHFNLAVLTEDTGSFKVANAQQPETAVEDLGLTASASDQETPPKTPYRNSSATKNTGRAQPTGAVPPTCRRDHDYVIGIPAGYESDNSWDCNSNLGEPKCTCNNNITLLLAYRPWRSHSNRGQGQIYSQGNNITVQGGNAPHQRLWDRQPYRRKTRSQEALRARAYRKWLRRYQIP